MNILARCGMEMRDMETESENSLFPVEKLPVFTRTGNLLQVVEIA
jgi:hypothetical protein